ncbi:hypothetical protein E2C01_049356 [Portunus trituberculatus]|uniref:Uncharacterized protein n=1 Tax=Portunus trituberculatus TaxID=210409 RepID=A0A5B7G663_PORTR|nr:hypothetical protein [Portunus trituberculatus]
MHHRRRDRVGLIKLSKLHQVVPMWQTVVVVVVAAVKPRPHADPLETYNRHGLAASTPASLHPRLRLPRC